MNDECKAWLNKVFNRSLTEFVLVQEFGSKSRGRTLFCRAEPTASEHYLLSIRKSAETWRSDLDIQYFHLSPLFFFCPPSMSDTKIQ